MQKAFEGRRKPDAERFEEAMKAMKAENLNPEPGEFAVVPPDGNERLGHIHFPIKEGDLLFKVTFPKGGDYSLYQMRSTGDGWRVVALCVD